MSFTPRSSLARALTGAGGLYNVTDSSMANFRVAMSTALNGGANAHIACIGDSITQGSGATDYSKSWPDVLRALISGRIGTDRGTGIKTPYHFPGSSSTGNLTDPRFLLTGTWTNSFGWGPAGGSMVTQVNGATATFTDTFDNKTIYSGNSTLPLGGATSTLDGVASTAISSVSSDTRTVTTITPGSQGSHTVVLTSVNAGSGYGLDLLGVEMRRNGSTGGVRVSNLSHYGLQSTSCADATQGQRSALYCTFDMVAPHLSIICYESNEINNSLSLATYQTALQTLITRSKLTGDVLLVSSPPRSGKDGATQVPYTNLLYTMADLNNVGLLDLQYGIPGYAAWNSAGLMSDLAHPADKGYRYIATAAFGALVRMGIGF